jgi:hypothetical protein
MGQSSLEHSFAAGREAALQALRALPAEKPALVIVYTTPKYELAALLAGIRSVTEEALLLGATGSGQITDGEYRGIGSGVAVLAMTAGDYRFGLASASHIRGDLDHAGQTLAREARAQAGSGKYGLIVLLADSLLGDLQNLVRGVYRVTGPHVPIVGGAAGDEQKFVATFVFHNGQVVEEGAVALWISSDRPFTVATRHGWQPLSAPILVTRSADFTIHSLAGRPAGTVFEEILGLQPGQLPPDKFWETSLYHPLGILQPDGNCVIRVARSRTEDGSLKILGSCPPAGSAVQVMQGNSETLLGVVDDFVATAMHASPQPGVFLVFSCASRATVLKERASEEASRLYKAAGGVPVFGIYCCGEFSRTVSVLGTHNATLTGVVL